MDVVNQVAAGDRVQVDNANFLAAETYHRHKVPGPDFKDFEGAGTFSVPARLPQSPSDRVTLKIDHQFAKPGTYFPTLRVVGQRQGDSTSPYARITNLARVRVVVK